MVSLEQIYVAICARHNSRVTQYLDLFDASHIPLTPHQSTLTSLSVDDADGCIGSAGHSCTW